MMNRKRVNINGTSTVGVLQNGTTDICRIENIGKDEYYVYNDTSGQSGVLIAKLDTVDIVELIVTGSIIREDIEVYTI